MDSPKQKPTSSSGQFNPQKAYPSPKSLPSPEVLKFEEFARIPVPPLSLDHPCLAFPEHTRSVGMSDYFHHAGSSLTGAVYGLDFERSTSIHTEHNLQLTGPLDVAGTISARNIKFSGDFIVSDTIDAYGNIDINGNMTAEYAISVLHNVHK